MFAEQLERHDPPMAEFLSTEIKAVLVSFPIQETLVICCS